MAPNRPAKMTRNVTAWTSIMPGPDGLGHRGAEPERRHEVEERRPDDRLAWRQDARRHDGRDGIGRVVKTVDVIEREGDENQQADDGKLHSSTRA